MTKEIDTGVFLPVGRHGWVHSVNAPETEDASYARVLRVVQAAESVGFDFVLSPSIWRGRKGPSQHWGNVLESLTTSAALLQATAQIKVYSTAHMTVFPPATIAKMVATMDQIAPGRAGLNVVTGPSYLDLAHIGLWNDDLAHDERYDMGDEWISVVKRLWTEEVVDHKGKFFETVEGTMGPKPTVMPRLINAGASPRGFRFAAENCDVAFISAGDDPAAIETARRGKQIARDLGRDSFATYGVVSLIPAATDEEAAAKLDHFNAGVDLECLDDIEAGYSQNRSRAALSDASTSLSGGVERSCVLPGTMVGSYETLARRLATSIIEGDLDGLMVMVPDYVEDLDGLARNTFPLLPDLGIHHRVAVQPG